MNNRRAAAKAAIFLFFFFWAVTFVNGSHAGTDMQKDQTTVKKQITFYHTYGYKKGGTWVIPMRAWVHEPADIVRQIAAKAAMEVMEEKTGMDELTQEEKNLFMARTKDFIADSESNELVILEFDNDAGGKRYQVKRKNRSVKTNRNGRIEGDITLSQETVQRLLLSQNIGSNLLRFQAVSNGHVGIGYITIIPPKGLSVISDIDDTVKITQIPDGESTVLKNTFFREFVAVPCMAQMYEAFGKETSFHYVSGGPWQMYGSLYDFLFSESQGFPRGSFHMKNLRTNPFESESYKDFWALG